MNKNTVLNRLFTLIMFSVSWSLVLAKPLPSKIPIEQILSLGDRDFLLEELREDFYFMLDRNPELRLIYFVPKNGGIRARKTGAGSVPELAVRTIRNELRIAGTFSTTGFSRNLELLKQEAVSQGYRLVPAPVAKAETSYLLAGFTLPNGKVKSECSFNIAQQEPLDCRLWSEETNSYSIPSNSLLSFIAGNHRARSVAGNIRFNFSLQKSIYEKSIKEALQSGIEWDHLLFANIDWTIKFDREIESTQMQFDWHKLYLAAFDFASRCEFSCAEDEVSDFFKEIAQCLDESQGYCEMGLSFVNDQGYYAGISDSDLRQQYISYDIRAAIEKKVFTRVLAGRSYRQNGVSRSVQYVPVVDGKLYHRRIETRSINSHLGMDMSQMRTFYRVDCIKGSIGERLQWNRDDSFCISLI